MMGERISFWSAAPRSRHLPWLEGWSGTICMDTSTSTLLGRSVVTRLRTYVSIPGRCPSPARRTEDGGQRPQRRSAVRVLLISPPLSLTMLICYAPTGTPQSMYILPTRWLLHLRSKQGSKKGKRRGRDVGCIHGRPAVRSY
jgi:hypothetical protein